MEVTNGYRSRLSIVTGPLLDQPYAAVLFNSAGNAKIFVTLRISAFMLALRTIPVPCQISDLSIVILHDEPLMGYVISEDDILGFTNGTVLYANGCSAPGHSLSLRSLDLPVVRINKSIENV